MKVDKTPDGHFADLNMNSGGTEVCLCYKKKVCLFHQCYPDVCVRCHAIDLTQIFPFFAAQLSSISELHTKWLESTIPSREQQDVNALTGSLSPQFEQLKQKPKVPSNATRLKPSLGASKSTGKSSEVRETGLPSPVSDEAMQAESNGTIECLSLLC